MDEELRKAIMARAAATAQNAQGALGRTSMTSPSASRLPTSDFSSIQSRQQPTLPFAGGGTATMGLGGASVNYPYSRGMMAGSPESFASRLPQAPSAPSNLFSASPVAESLRPTSGGMLNQQYTNPFASPAQRMGENLSLGLTALPTQPNIGIGGGPMSLRGEAAMTSPQTAEQRGLTPTAVREGTVYATPQQLANLNARTTAFEGRTPEQQQALLAQMRERGAALAAQQTETMKTFAESRGARFAPMPAPQGRFGQPLTGLFPQSKEAIAQRTEPRGMERLAAFPSAIGFTEMQKQQANAMPPQIRNQSLFGGMGYSSVFGGPQPTSSMVAAGPIEEQIRKRIFGTI